MDIHVHIHIDLAPLLNLEQGAQIMEDVTSLNVKLDELKEVVQTERSEVQNQFSLLNDRITVLSAQLASGVPVSQADLDALGAKITEAKGAIAGISEAFPTAPVDSPVDPSAPVA